MQNIVSLKGSGAQTPKEDDNESVKTSDSEEEDQNHATCYQVSSGGNYQNEPFFTGFVGQKRLHKDTAPSDEPKRVENDFKITKWSFVKKRLQNAAILNQQESYHQCP